MWFLLSGHRGEETGRNVFFFSPLDLVLFAIPFSFASAFVVFSFFFFFFFPVQCPAHEVRFDSTGVILSPGFPENYPNLQMCSWLINVEKGYNITLHFELFQTEKEFDILEIFDGKSLVLELIRIVLNVFSISRIRDAGAIGKLCVCVCVSQVQTFTARAWHRSAATSRPPLIWPPRATSCCCDGRQTTAPTAEASTSDTWVSIKVCIQFIKIFSYQCIHTAKNK